MEEAARLRLLRLCLGSGAEWRGGQGGGSQSGWRDEAAGCSACTSQEAFAPSCQAVRRLAR
eukprot:4554013-Pleurochrysis_carterae.AAC.1